MPADVLAPIVARASADIVLAVEDRQHVFLFEGWFHLLGWSQIQDTIQNVNIPFVIFKTIQHVKSICNTWVCQPFDDVIMEDNMPVKWGWRDLNLQPESDIRDGRTRKSYGPILATHWTHDSNSRNTTSPVSMLWFWWYYRQFSNNRRTKS